MPPSRVRLLALSSREFERHATIRPALPASQRFKGIRVNLNKLDPSWDKKRGAAARLMGVLLRENDQQLQQRVCADRDATKTYTEAAAWLEQEAQYLRKVSALMDTASTRLAAVIERCGHPGSIERASPLSAEPTALAADRTRQERLTTAHHKEMNMAMDKINPIGLEVPHELNEAQMHAKQAIGVLDVLLALDEHIDGINPVGVVTGAVAQALYAARDQLLQVDKEIETAQQKLMKQQRAAVAA